MLLRKEEIIIVYFLIIFCVVIIFITLENQYKTNLNAYIVYKILGIKFKVILVEGVHWHNKNKCIRFSNDIINKRKELYIEYLGE